MKISIANSNAKSVTKGIATGVFVLALQCISSVAHADSVEITLADELDGIKSGYCLDIARGQKEAADPANGLQAHTCYSHEGQLAVDQIFDSESFEENQLFMPEFNVCATVSEVAVGATVALDTCENREEQQFAIQDNGNITAVADPTLCITAAQETTTGRSKTNLMRALSLQVCSDDSAATQVWRTRTEDD